MKSMRFVSALCIAVALALLLPAGSLWAQAAKAFGATLTPEQQEKFKEMNVAAEPAKKAIRENTKLSDEEKHVQLKAVYDGIRKKLTAILTPEQVKEMESAPVHKASMPHGPGKAFGATLTPEQHEKFKEMNVAAEPAKKAIRENTKLSDEEKHVQMKAVYDGIRKKLTAILTPEQVKEMVAVEKK